MYPGRFADTASNFENMLQNLSHGILIKIIIKMSLFAISATLISPAHTVPMGRRKKDKRPKKEGPL